MVSRIETANADVRKLISLIDVDGVWEVIETFTIPTSANVNGRNLDRADDVG
jgi:hypothetical protein